jgi:hypothetical protein
LDGLPLLLRRALLLLLGLSATRLDGVLGPLTLSPVG